MSNFCCCARSCMDSPIPASCSTMTWSSPLAIQPRPWLPLHAAVPAARRAAAAAARGGDGAHLSQYAVVVPAGPALGDLAAGEATARSTEQATLLPAARTAVRGPTEQDRIPFSTDVVRGDPEVREGS